MESLRDNVRRWVLGSRSPRRLELLRTIVPADLIEVLPPRSSVEMEFEGLSDWPAIRDRLQEIARTKCDDVLGQVRSAPPADALSDDADRGSVIVLTADTTIVVERPEGGCGVLGQPPDDEAWRAVVAEWFRSHYFGRTHVAATAFCLGTLDGPRVERVVRTEVTFAADGERWLEWYLNTGEPRGKAGGYALQGAGSVFIERVNGSLSNVIGLPLREVMEAIAELDATP